jgi:Uma2 family endonuclease
MLQPQSLVNWPTVYDLPDSDETPVDNELQNLVPNLLLAILATSWALRQDWFFGIDMGIYYQPGQYPQTPIVPDGLLSLGVVRRKSESGRLSYVLWEESNIMPVFVLEVVSQTYRSEYEDKLDKYAELGVKYYCVYNPDPQQRKGHQSLEVYRLSATIYQLMEDEPVWMPEINLGIGRDQGVYKGWQRDWLYWFDQIGQRYLSPDELLERSNNK